MNKIKTTVITIIITLVFYCAIFNTKSSYADNKELPLVSVIMPIWNSEKFINQAVDSVINQTYKNLEIILVDDCKYLELVYKKLIIFILMINIYQLMIQYLV